MSRKWKISLFSLLFILLIFVVTACDNNKSNGNQDPEWGEWVVTKAATCTEEGVETRTAKNDSSKTETRAIQKKAHTPGQAVHENVKPATCTVDGSYDEVVYCTKCETKLSTKHHTEDHTGHDYHSSSQAATCEHAETITYTCENCGNHYEVTGSPKLQHQLEGKQKEATTLVSGETCKYQVTTTDVCELCGKEVTLTINIIEKHNYTAAVTKEATCTEKGVITYTCTHDNKSYTEAIPVNTDAHTWNNGTTDDKGVTTFACTHCDAEKKTFSAKTEIQQAVPAEIMQQATEIELKNATIAFDENAKETFNGAENVTIKADTVNTEDLNLDENTMAKIGDSTVFDFTCQVGSTQVSQFMGSVKVTLPYTLSEGEDPNNIAVWYLDGETPTQINAVYSNNTVTFETNHFSRYVIVKLTPEELCEMYDHVWTVVLEKDATCSQYGEIMTVCSRCGEVHNELTEMVDHDFDIDHEHSVAPTYDAEGYTEYACRNCDATKRVIIPKKPRPADNRIQNLINSLFEEDYFISVDGLEQLANVAMANSQIKLTEDGNIYMISRAVNQETGEVMLNIVDMGNGLAYYVSDDGYRISTASMNFDLNMIKKMVYAVTELIPTDLGNTVLEKALPILFDVETTDTEVTLTFNTEKLITLYDNLLNKTIGENVDILIGKGTTTALTTLVDAALDMTVSELVTLLEGMGITVDTVADLVKQIPGTELFNADSIKGFITLAGNMKVLDVINAAIPMLQQMMSNDNQNQANPQTPISNGTTPLVQETETEEPVDGDDDASEEETTFVPITKKQIMDGLTGILAMKVTDLVAMFAPNGEAIIAQLPTKADLETLTEDLLDLKITLNNKYQFKKLEAEVKFNETIKTMAKVPAGMDVDITAVIEHQNKEDVLNVNDTIVLVKDACDTFNITLDNSEWFTTALADYLKMNSNTALTFDVSRTDGGYLVKSSTFKVEANEWTDEGPEIKQVDAYYVFMVSNDSANSRYVYRDGNKIYKTINLNGYLVYKLSDDQLEQNQIYLYGKLTYDPTTETYTFGKETYNNPCFSQYDYITKEQYEAARNYKLDMDKPENYIFYKYTNLFTNKVSYDYDRIGNSRTDFVYFLTDEQMAAGKQSSNSIFGDLKIYYDSAIVSYYIRYKATADGFVFDGIYANVQVINAYYVGGVRATYSDSLQVAVTENVDLGTFKITFGTPTAVNDCTKKYTVTVLVRGIEEEFEYFKSTHVGETTRTETKIDDCHYHIVEKCSACNEVRDEYDSTRHDYQTTEIVKAVGTLSGLRITECSKCHEGGYVEEYWCEHYNVEYNEETEEYTCRTCGFTWSGVRRPVIFLNQVENDADIKISYQLTDDYKYDGLSRFTNFYDIGLFIYYEVADEEAESGKESGYFSLDVDYRVAETEYRKYDETTYTHKYMVFDRMAVREAMSAWLQENYKEGIQYKLYIGVTDYMGGNYSYFLEISLS
jgi:hypothetical protein